MVVGSAVSEVLLIACWLEVSSLTLSCFALPCLVLRCRALPLLALPCLALRSNETHTERNTEQAQIRVSETQSINRTNRAQTERESIKTQTAASRYPAGQLRCISLEEPKPYAPIFLCCLLPEPKQLDPVVLPDPTLPLRPRPIGFRISGPSDSVYSDNDTITISSLAFSSRLLPFPLFPRLLPFPSSLAFAPALPSSLTIRMTAPALPSSLAFSSLPALSCSSAAMTLPPAASPSPLPAYTHDNLAASLCQAALPRPGDTSPWGTPAPGGQPPS